ncbi:kit ligand isoform X2 [Hyla sarda]|uniref:kit ligand isoform X2 n=1 Tax=Hyla sarda TaxID=327740 RepID=UPI0024C2C33F|nr:kit ligand isoform X2 [Hyla sarda]
MKKTKTWIITCIYLQLFFVCFGSPCTNPLTDAVHDIEKLVGNLPNDYIMRLKRVPAKDHLAKHCWLYVMVHELSSRLEVLVNRFANTSQNYKILGDLTLIFREIRNCVNLNEQMDFIEEYLDNISEGEFVPREFFNSVTSTFDVFKDINNTNYNTTCDLPTSDPELSYITNGNTQYASSHLRNSTRIVPGYTESIEMNSRLPLQWPSIASIALMSIVVGFAFGVLCWKVKHRRGHTETAIPGITVDQREANENMLQQTAREVSVI